MAVQQVYKFKGSEGLYADVKGKFFFNGVPARKVFNKGSIAVLCGRSKRGIINLRRLAYKAWIEIEEPPF